MWYWVVATLLASVTVGQVTQLHGSGTTNPSKLIWKVNSILEERTRGPTRMTYRAVGSGTGQKEFIGADNSFNAYNDYGSGDIPMGQADFDTLSGQGKVMLHVPFLMGGVSFFHSVPDMPTLKLTACVLSDIFQKRITTWDHASIKALNPGFSPPSGQMIHVARRVHGSSSTAGVTEYLDVATKAAGSECSANPWAIGVGKGGDGNMPTWPSGLVERQGSDGMAGYLNEQAWAIAYIDAGHGHRLGLHEVALKNADGTFLTSKEAIISDASNGLTLPAGDASWATVSLLNRPGARTWPITAFSYFYVRKDQSATGATGQLLKAFLTYMLHDEVQNNMLAEFGFEPLGASALAHAQSIVNSITVDTQSPAWIFESASTTQAGVGAGATVFSGKRRSFEEYSLTTLQDTLEEMHEKNEYLTMKLAEVKAEAETMKQKMDEFSAKLDQAMQAGSGSGSCGGAGNSVSITLNNHAS